MNSKGLRNFVGAVVCWIVLGFCGAFLSYKFFNSYVGELVGVLVAIWMILVFDQEEMYTSAHLRKFANDAFRPTLGIILSYFICGGLPVLLTIGKSFIICAIFGWPLYFLVWTNSHKKNMSEHQGRKTCSKN